MTQDTVVVSVAIGTHGVPVFENLRIEVVSGGKSKGELAGISQVSIWRNWFLDDSKELSDLQAETNK